MLTILFMALCGVSRIFHLESMRDKGFALLTGGPQVLSRHWVGGWVRHVRTHAARRFSRLTQRLRSFEALLPTFSLDEHTVARWTRKSRIAKGYHTIRNKHMRCEKLFYFFDVVSNRFIYLLPTLGRIGLHAVARGLLRVLRRETRFKGLRLILDAGSTLKDSEFRALLRERKATILARAPRRPHLLERWKALPPDQFVQLREPGAHKGAPEKIIFVAETRTALKGDGPEDKPVRTIVVKESKAPDGRPNKKDRWHVLYTSDEMTKDPYDLVKEFRARQHHEQGYRVMVHDEALDAVTNGYNKKARNPRRPGFNHGPIHIVGWLKALAFNMLQTFSKRLPGFSEAHPRTLRRFFLNRPGRLWQTSTEIIVQLDYFPEQLLLQTVVEEVNAKKTSIPWLEGRRLVVSLTPEPVRRAHRRTETSPAGRM